MTFVESSSKSLQNLYKIVESYPKAFQKQVDRNNTNPQENSNWGKLPQSKSVFFQYSNLHMYLLLPPTKTFAELSIMKKWKYAMENYKQL